MVAAEELEGPGLALCGRRVVSRPWPVHVRPSTLLALASFLGVMIAGVLWGVSQTGLVEISVLPTTLLAVGCYLTAILAHEGGHLVMSRACGAQVVWVRLSARSGVIIDETPTGGRRALISAAGPVAEMLWGGGLLLTALALSESWQLGVGCAGALAIVNGLVGLLVPIRHDSDARKMWRGLTSLRRPAVPRELTPSEA